MMDEREKINQENNNQENNNQENNNKINEITQLNDSIESNTDDKGVYQQAIRIAQNAPLDVPNHYPGD